MIYTKKERRENGITQNAHLKQNKKRQGGTHSGDKNMNKEQGQQIENSNKYGRY